jgi:hypothetical protein
MAHNNIQQKVWTIYLSLTVYIFLWRWDFKEHVFVYTTQGHDWLPELGRPRTFCLLCLIHLPSAIPHSLVFSIYPSLTMQDGAMHVWCTAARAMSQTPKTVMHACNQIRSRLILVYWTKLNTTRCTVWACISPAWTSSSSWLSITKATNHTQ